MLVDLVFSLISAAVGPLISALPVATLPTFGNAQGNEDQAQTLGRTLGTMDMYVPILGPLKFLGLLLTFGGALLAFRLVTWAWKMIRG